MRMRAVHQNFVARLGATGKRAGKMEKGGQVGGMRAGRMLTWKESTLGMRVWQACTHLPSTSTSQVPHSPFLHLYGMKASACPARLVTTARREQHHTRNTQVGAGANAHPAWLQPATRTHVRVPPRRCQETRRSGAQQSRTRGRGTRQNGGEAARATGLGSPRFQVYLRSHLAERRAGERARGLDVLADLEDDVDVAGEAGALGPVDDVLLRPLLEHYRLAVLAPAQQPVEEAHPRRGRSLPQRPAVALRQRERGGRKGGGRRRERGGGGEHGGGTVGHRGRRLRDAKRCGAAARGLTGLPPPSLLFLLPRGRQGWPPFHPGRRECVLLGGK